MIVKIQSDTEFLSGESVNSEFRLMEKPDIHKAFIYLRLQKESAQFKYMAKRSLMSLRREREVSFQTSKSSPGECTDGSHLSK